MRTLPDSPNLDHLRQQAKDVLAQLQAARPGATLADAQARVAELYGFRTRPDLKAEVERRCGSARVLDDGTAEALAVVFDIGSPLGSLVALERQWAGQAWVLTTDRGRWLARSLNDWFDDCAIERDVLMAEAAAAAGVLTLRPVRTHDGRIIAASGGARWRLYALPPVGPEPSLPADPRYAAAAGRVVATVHRLGLPAPEPIGPWLTFVRSEEQWWNLHRAAQGRDMAWADLLAEAIPAIMDVSRVVEPADGPAAAVTVLSGRHYAANAFRVAGPSDLVVMGWDHAGAIPPRWDLGGVLAGWSSGVRGEVNAAAARAVVTGYAEVSLLPHPLDLGMFSTAVCAALSWLASRIRICLVETGFEQEQASKAVPWLLAEPPSRACFERILDAIR
ncbi:MAG TPA: hypothetical protein VM287_05700 [Egibacteraceae bacterium]|jgi:hypothetical protein|nr:hypothetical protein [Egibacteraceae bacterium]